MAEKNRQEETATRRDSDAAQTPPHVHQDYDSPISGFGEQPRKGGKIHYGGQAVIEGVMMRGPEKVATAVRMPTGEIAINTEEFLPSTRRHRILRLPIVRGGATLIESLMLGIRALNYSASVAMEELGEEEGDSEEVEGEAREAAGPEDASGAEPAADAERAHVERADAEQAQAEPRIEHSEHSDQPPNYVPPEEFPEPPELRRVPPPRNQSDWKTKAALTGTMVFAFGLGIIFFFWIPLMLADFIMNTTGTHGGILFNLIDGAIRVVFFLAYIWGISLWGEMRRVFEYHGAEHKTIFMQEAGEELTPANAHKYTTKHPRCGTSFLLIVMVVSILVFMLTGRPQNFGHRLIRIALIPVIAGLSYEVMKLSAKYSARRWARFLSGPGIWLQNITTKQPSDDQVEVAIASLKAVLVEEAPMGIHQAGELAGAGAGTAGEFVLPPGSDEEIT